MSNILEMRSHSDPTIDALRAVTMVDASSVNGPILNTPPHFRPRFRILVVGSTGVGKSSLIASIFNVSQEDIDIADGHAGTANINREYTSDDNPCFALHDSNGFEPGSTEHWRVIETFIRQRSQKNLPFEQRIHALWLCIETPRTGARLMQTADEDLLKLAAARNIAVVVVFTKFDLLFNEFHLRAVRNQGRQDISSIDLNQVVEDARASLRESIQAFKEQYDLLEPSKRLPWSQSKRALSYVGVSTNHQFLGFMHSLRELTEATKKCLHTQETFAPRNVCPRMNTKFKLRLGVNIGRLCA